MEEVTPLQPVKDCCRRLRQEWEAMMHDADTASTQMLSSLKAQELALTTERTHVQSLKLETEIVKRSFLQQTQEQEKKASSERLLADQIRKNIQNQLREVKQMQCELMSGLAEIRTSMDNLRKPKQEEDLANSIALSSATCELLGLEIVLSVEDEDSSILVGSSGVSNSHYDKHRLEADTSISRFWETKNGASAPGQCFEQSYGKVKTEALSNEDFIQGNEHVECGVKLSSSLQTCYNGPLVHRKRQVDPISARKEPQEPSGELQIPPCNERAMSVNVALERDLDELDKILLSERLEILVQQIRDRQDYLGIPREGDELLRKKKQSAPERNLRGKRKRDVPIEVALQEDAPGLLEKLVERGLVDDIAIYGASWEGECENGEDHFKDLECIASKLWGTPSGLLKQPQAIRQHASGLGRAPTYCLSCLVSLIEQAKSLKQRSWPVEWGWCRELQAFIFVFDKHNRIVLERPEYGNATYFFELVQLLPVKWQVLRLIRVLSVTALGKTALLENRPLEVGHELTAEESKILGYYGWAPSTGLGSFLNFCDRVFHDVYQDGKEEDNLDWRQRIGKCLMDGYDRGRIITRTLPPRFLEESGNAEWEDIKPNTTPLT